MNTRQPLIKIKQLQKSFANRVVLDIDTLIVYQDECVVVHGSNGSGKSTLLKIMAGLIKPDQGVMNVNGTDHSWRQAIRSFRAEAVYLHQAPYLFDRSVESNVAYGLRLRDGTRNEIHQKVATALEWAGLAHLAQRNARDLSGGEKQRVALTRARILQPKLLLLDEPTAAMDRKSRQQTFNLIRDIASGGHAVYIATHESSELYQPDRVITLDDGRITA